MTPAARERHRKRLLDLKAEIIEIQQLTQIFLLLLVLFGNISAMKKNWGDKFDIVQLNAFAKLTI